jgi:uncharacterized protein YgiM (DUF1202 family)
MHVTPLEKHAVVVTAYETPYPDPLKLAQGEVLTIGDRKSDWPGWVWCTDSSGKQGWVPESWLGRNGDRAVLKRDYDATELTVAEGDELVVLAEESSWFQCRTTDGTVGWVPRENVRPV